jgi:hypothetical protein
MPRDDHVPERAEQRDRVVRSNELEERTLGRRFPVNDHGHPKLPRIDVTTPILILHDQCAAHLDEIAHDFVLGSLDGHCFLAVVLHLAVVATTSDVA